MKQWQTILVKVLWSIGGLALLCLFIIAWKDKTSKKISYIQVELIGPSTTAIFMDEMAIRTILNDQGIKEGMPLDQVNLTALENSIEKTEWIKNAEFYVNNKQVLEVKIEQRIPIARIFTLPGSSFYIDIEGNRLPLKQLTILNLPVFTGFPTDQEKLSKPDSILLDQILFFVKTIKDDSFFNAQIAQVNIEANGDFQMVPTIGDHLVLLGNLEKLEHKLNRLYTFYKKVWVQSGLNAYSVLDCRFDNQLIALQKGMQPIQFNGLSMPAYMDSVTDTNNNINSTSTKIISTATTASTTATTAASINGPRNPGIAPQVLSTKAKSAAIVKKVAPKPVKIKQVKANQNTKSKKGKLNNKPNKNSFINKKQSAKAVMPKKKASNN